MSTTNADQMFQSIIHMQTTPAAPLLTPLSVQSSPSSSFFLDQTVNAANKQSHKAYKLKDVPLLSGLDDADDEVDDVSVDEERPLEKSYWSDDSDIDEDEDQDQDTEDQTDSKDTFGRSVTLATDFGTQDKETDKQTFEVEGKEDIQAAIVLEETDNEIVGLNGSTHTGSSCRLNGISRKSVPRPSIQDNVRE